MMSESKNKKNILTTAASAIAIGVVALAVAPVAIAVANKKIQKNHELEEEEYKEENK